LFGKNPILLIIDLIIKAKDFFFLKKETKTFCKDASHPVFLIDFLYGNPKYRNNKIIGQEEK